MAGVNVLGAIVVGIVSAVLIALAAIMGIPLPNIVYLFFTLVIFLPSYRTALAQSTKLKKGISILAYLVAHQQFFVFGVVPSS